RRAPRPLATCRGVGAESHFTIAMKPPTSEIGFQSNGSTLPLASLIDPERNDLLNIASAGVHPRHTRRALYSELVDAGLGFESVAFMSEHGPNASFLGGRTLFRPLAYISIGGRKY